MDGCRDGWMVGRKKEQREKKKCQAISQAYKPPNDLNFAHPLHLQRRWVI